MRKGFTLVELSIVLVIIGLLIGGILIGQTLIESAKITSTVQQIQQLDAGVLAFKAKYKSLPGDGVAFGGNGNGIIEMADVSLNNASGFVCEIANFWYNMNPSQFPGKSACAQPGAKLAISGTAKNAPAAKIGKSGSSIAVTGLTLDGGYADNLNIKNVYFILDPSQATSLSSFGYYNFLPTTSANSAVTPVNALALDQKIDDGAGNKGTVLSGSIGNFGGGGTGSIVVSPPSTCSDSGTGAYAVTNTGYECTPIIRVGAQAGVPL